MSDTSFSDSFNFDPSSLQGTDFYGQQTGTPAPSTDTSSGGSGLNLGTFDFTQPTSFAPSTAPSSDTAAGGSSGGGFFSNLGTNLTNYLSQPSNLMKLGLAGGGGLLGLYESNKAQNQASQARSQIGQIPNDLKALSSATQDQLNQISQNYQTMVSNAASAMQNMAAPMMQQFQGLLQATNNGQLTPANQQVFDAARAQLAQQAQSRGGVGTEQITAQLARLKNTLLASQQTQALQLYQTASPAVVSGLETNLTGTQAANQYKQAGMETALSATQLGDQYMLDAIRTGLQESADARNSMTNFYGALAQVLAGTSTKSATP